MAGAPVMRPIANGRTLVVGEMPSLAGIIVATLLVDVMWPPGVDVPLPSLVDGSAALPDVVGWTVDPRHRGVVPAGRRGVGGARCSREVAVI